MTLALVPPLPIEYEPDGRREGPCECAHAPCHEDTACPVCSVIDTYEGCPLQGFGCGWHPDPCECCTPEQRATTRRVTA